MKTSRIYAVILAGGQSSRLFPFNKVLSDLTGSGKSLIQQAHDRLGLPRKQVYVLTVKEMVAPIRRQLRLPPRNFFVDPVRRGTWPAILWAMANLRHKDSNAVLAIVTGDHVINGVRDFRKSFGEAIRIAAEGPSIVMLGIPPSANAQEWRAFGCFRVGGEGHITGFEEKPTLERSQQMIEEGDWQWNSGMFFFRLQCAEQALHHFQPEMFLTYTAMSDALHQGKKREAARLFENFPSKIPHPLDPGRSVDNSIDYAVMTPLVASSLSGVSARAVQGVRFLWTDLGQWDALRKVVKADSKGNVLIGSVRPDKGVRDSILVAEQGHRIDASGVRHLVMALASKTALVLSTENLPRIKEFVQNARQNPAKRIVTDQADALSITLKGKRLIVSTKPGFIR